MRFRGTDRRVLKTRRSLHDALVSLIHEKSYDSIAVKEIVSRANIGRSAFYMHFADKDALLASGIQEILRMTPPRAHGRNGRLDSLLSFSFPIFAYVNQCQRDAHARMSHRGRTVVHDHLRRVLHEHLREEWRREPSHRIAHAVPGDLLLEYVVGTFILVLNWWVDTTGRPDVVRSGDDRQLSALEIDELFLSLVTPTLSGIGRGEGDALATTAAAGVAKRCPRLKRS